MLSCPSHRDSHSQSCNMSSTAPHRCPKPICGTTQKLLKPLLPSSLSINFFLSALNSTHGSQSTAALARHALPDQTAAPPLCLAPCRRPPICEQVCTSLANILSEIAFASQCISDKQHQSTPELQAKLHELGMHTDFAAGLAEALISGIRASPQAAVLLEPAQRSLPGLGFQPT